MESNKPYYIKELFTKEINDVIYCGIKGIMIQIIKALKYLYYKFK